MEARTSDNQATIVVPTTTLMLLLLGVLVFLGIYQMEPPSVVSADAAPTVFSADRAMQHVQAIAQNPRPVGSAESAAARDYIVAQLNSLGLEPEVQATDVTRTLRNGQESSARIQNVLARIEGTANTNNAVAIAGHYDSVERAAGASDDASAIGAMLETARAMLAGNPPSNDVIFIFTDAEERGLLGAQAFIDQHPWAPDVKVVLNFEARGTTGPSYMFETSDNNGWLVRQFAQAAPNAVGYSFTFDIYQLLPNDTDLTVFRAADKAGIGFAFIDGYINYHLPTDNLANLNPRSVQHHGNYMLSLAQQMANTSLDTVQEPNRVYFSLFGLIIHYPASWNLLLMIITLIAFLAVLVLGFRRRRLTALGLLAGFFIFLLVLIVTLASIFAFSYIIPVLGVEPINMLNGATYNWNLFAISYVCLALGITSALYVAFRKRVLFNNLLVGAWLWWLIFQIATTFLLPGTSYLFTWPLLISLIALVVRFRAEDEDAPRPTVVLALLPAISGILLMTPLIRGLFVALFLPIYVPVLLFVVLLLGLLLPHLTMITRRYRWALPIAAIVIGINLFLFAALTAGVGA
ncbi:MAG: M28 family peptidase [Chloroflexi bacterium]|nr:M28 family peptidase [Chloroflexota bacterium]